MGQLKYLIVSTGRSGSVYAARLLTSVGVPCGHESIFDLGGLQAALCRLQDHMPAELSQVATFKMVAGRPEPIERWVDPDEIVADSSYLAVPFLRAEPLKDTKIVHLVRNPLDVINSFVNYLHYFQHPYPSAPYGKAYEAFIYRHAADLTKGMTQVERACRYWLLWNEMIERSGKVDFLWRVEDDPAGLFDFLGVKDPENVFDDPTVNTFADGSRKLRIEDIENLSCQSMIYDAGREYGYFSEDLT